MYNISLFSKRLKKARIDQGYTQRGLAEKSGIYASYISNYEKGKNYPTLINLIVLSDVLKVHPGYLLGGDDIL